MKKVIAFLFMFFMPFSSFGMVGSTYSVCYQVGAIEKDVVLATSGIIYISDKQDHLKCFLDKIQKVIKGFESDYEPACYGYDTIDAASKSFNKKMKLAKKRNFKILFIK